MFYEVILLWGGPRLANFVALNLHGPEIHCVFWWRNAGATRMECGLVEGNFQALQSLYCNASTTLPRVPVLLAEDETAIVPAVQYLPENDSLLGFCGQNNPQHQCEDKCDIRVEDGEDGYRTIVEAFATKRIGTQARAIIVNPLHPMLPKIPVLIQPTCNRFNAAFVNHHWETTSQFYAEHLEDATGPLLDHSSDGDSRRGPLMLTKAVSQQGLRHQPIRREDGFFLTAEKLMLGDNHYVLRNLMDQDYVHHHKKLINQLFHASRMLQMGPFLVHASLLLLICDRFGYEDVGLNENDVTRQDRQDWRSAQKLCLQNVQDRLEDVIVGSNEHRPNGSVLGTRVFLQMVWYYIEIFISGKASLLQCIKYAAIVCHFLAIWRNFVIRTPGLTLSRNFLSRETYTDVLISAHFAVSLITYMRDEYPTSPCHLELSGTDVVESYRSMNGQWVGNRHTYDFGWLQRNLTHMIRLEQIRVNPFGPEFARPSHKGEIIWSRQYGTDWQPADLSAYPAVGDEVPTWREGAALARDLVRRAGMIDDAVRHGQEDGVSWIISPFSVHGSHLKSSP